MAQGTQAEMPVQRLHLRKVQPHHGEAAGHGGTGQSAFNCYFFTHFKDLIFFVLQVALKRQQAAEDAIALGIRAMATGQRRKRSEEGRVGEGRCGRGGEWVGGVG